MNWNHQKLEWKKWEFLSWLCTYATYQDIHILYKRYPNHPFGVTVLLSTFYSNFVNFWVDSCYGQLSMIYYSHIGKLSIDLKLKRIIVSFKESCMVKLSMKFSVLNQYKKIVNDLLQPYNQIVNFNINFSYELKPYKTTVNDFFAITAVLSICKLLNPNLT